jgi:hypothetical protein
MQALVPKVAVLRGGLVLHASAFAGASGGVTIVCGASGAGKTTTASACTDAGANLVSADKVVLTTRDGRASVALEGERRLESWVTRAAADLAALGAASCQELDAASAGPAARVERVLFIDAERRSGDQILLQALDQAAAAASLFHNVFFGSDSPDDWRRTLASCAQLARAVPAYAATMPAGLPALWAAAPALLTRPPSD